MRTFMIISFLFLCISLPAVNHMDIIATMEGQLNENKLGLISTSLDWNGDGYDDLFLSSIWTAPEIVGTPNGYPYGKIYAYWGGPNFDNASDFAFTGSYYTEYSYISMCNAGDMNGDGIDDLAMFKYAPLEQVPTLHHDLKLSIYFGGANPDTIPDYELVFPYNQWDNSGFARVRPLGDINHDGFDEIGYVIRPNSNNHPYYFHIVYGGQNQFQQTLFYTAGYFSAGGNLIGIGDVNEDGIDDFATGYLYGGDSTSYFYHNVIYFGNTSGVYSDSLVIDHGNTTRSENTYPAGDVNGDGIADFVSSFNAPTAKLYFGSPNLNLSNYTVLQNCTFGTNNGRGFTCGDFNGSHTSDIAGAYTDWFDGSGYANIWIGGRPMNGGLDLHLEPAGQYDNMMYGMSMTSGDYNGDGFCDLTVSAPFSQTGIINTHGIVFVYAGNAELDDPLPNAEDTQITSPNKLSLYPNPLRSAEALNVRFHTDGKKAEPAIFTIYNIKGQKVMSISLSAEQVKNGATMVNLNNLTSGVYVCHLQNETTNLRSKLSVVK